MIGMVVVVVVQVDMCADERERTLEMAVVLGVRWSLY